MKAYNTRPHHLTLGIQYIKSLMRSRESDIFVGKL